LFAALGRFSVRFRWPIIVLWLLGAVALAASLPSLASVEKGTNSAFLPPQAASTVAAQLASPLQPTHGATTTLVAATARGALDAADEAAVDRAEGAIRALPFVRAVVDQGVSANGRARKASIELAPARPRHPVPDATAVRDIRAAMAAAGPPAGLAVHLAGGVAASVDQEQQTTHVQALTEYLSIVFIVVLLFLIFRSLLAPLVALVPSAVALVAAGPVIAASSHLGVQVSTLTPILLTVLMLGAGTDYGLFLIFRVREEIRRGRSGHDAVAFSLTKVGESITFSALTVMAALGSLALASFGLYQGLGPGLAIGVAFALAANLTLLPALMAVLGRAAFWPRIPRAGQHRRGLWGATASRIVARPAATLVVGLVVFGGLSTAMLRYGPSGFASGGPAATSDSGEGQAILAADFPAAEQDPTSVVFRLPTPVWAAPAVLDRAEGSLVASGQFAAVTGPLDASGRRLAPAELAAAHAALAPLGPAASLPSQVPPGVAVAPDVYNAYRAATQFVSPDGRTVLYDVALRAGPPTSPAAVDAIPAVRQVVAGVSHQIGASAAGVAGEAPSLADVAAVSGSDLFRMIPVVLAVLALLLAAVLRSLVAPLYLVASVGLSYLASLGLAVLVFVVIGGQGGINFVLPFFMFIFIMALGEDYNILVMTRIREEAHHAPIAVAVRRAIGATGTTVTSAGLVLAGTFGVLTLAGDTQVREIGLGLAAGILLDTFLVRTLLVPSVAVLLGRWNWWPSHLWREEHAGDRVVPTTEELEETADLARRAAYRAAHPHHLAPGAGHRALRTGTGPRRW
jgi:RND superfamily putative drug exporter